MEIPLPIKRGKKLVKILECSGYNKISKVRKLINKEISLIEKNVYGSTPLHMVSARGEMGLCVMLIKAGAPIDAVDKENDTPFYYSFVREQHFVCKLLIDSGADVNHVGKNGGVLHMAAENSYIYEQMCHLVINNGADVNIKDKYGRTPLHVACKTGNLVICKLLLEFGASIDIKDNFGHTPCDGVLRNDVRKLLRKYSSKKRKISQL